MDEGSIDAWPCKKSFGPAPEEEMRKVMLEGSCNTAVGVNCLEKEEPECPNQSKGDLDKLIRVYGGMCLPMSIYGEKKRHRAQSSSTLLRRGVAC